MFPAHPDDASGPLSLALDEDSRSSTSSSASVGEEGRQSDDKSPSMSSSTSVVEGEGTQSSSLEEEISLA